jgi:CRP-like cAMP-binding protein
MSETGIRRVSRELFLAAFGVPVEHLDAWLIDRFTRSLEEHFVHAGDVLYGPARRLDFLYFMQEGRVLVTREGAAPWTFAGRWLIGTFELLRQGSHRRTATALLDFDALRIRGEALVELMEDSFLLTRGALVNSATTVAGLEARMPVVEDPDARSPPPPPCRPLDSVERLIFLKQVGVFRGASVQALAELAAASSEVRLGAGEAFPLQDPDREQFLFVVEGQVVTTRHEPDATRTYRSGDLVAGAAAIARKCQDWVARTTMPTRLLAMPLDAWYDQVEDHFDLARATLAALATRGDALLESLAEREGPGGLVLA